MSQKNNHILDQLDATLERRAELFRGNLLRWRGAKVGINFGLGRLTRFFSPGCFVAVDDVTIGEFSYLVCFSRNGVRIGSLTSIDRNLWLGCFGKTGTVFSY